MADSLDEKVAIVTGGGSGIGEALCQELARRGAQVVVADINADDGGRVAAATDIPLEQLAGAPAKMMQAARAAEVILDGVAHNQALIVFPANWIDDSLFRRRIRSACLFAGEATYQAVRE